MLKASNQVAKSKKELSGSLSGVRELVHNFARSRSKEWGDGVLSQIRTKNADVADYLAKRRDFIEAASFLDHGRNRGGRITQQLVESFFNMILPFRQFGLVEGIIWLSKRFQEKQEEERIACERWMRGRTDLKYLSRAAARAFEDECSAKMTGSL